MQKNPDGAPLNTLDRVDKNRGYVQGNTVTACYTCNKMKHIQTLDSFREQAKATWNLHGDHSHVVRCPDMMHACSFYSAVSVACTLGG